MHAFILTASLLLGAKPGTAVATAPSDDSSFDATIDGKAYRCSVTDMQGRYETICTPSEGQPSSKRPTVSER